MICVHAEPLQVTVCCSVCTPRSYIVHSRYYLRLQSRYYNILYYTIYRRSKRKKFCLPVTRTRPIRNDPATTPFPRTPWKYPLEIFARSPSVIRVGRSSENQYAYLDRRIREAPGTSRDKLFSKNLNNHKRLFYGRFRCRHILSVIFLRRVGTRNGRQKDESIFFIFFFETFRH